MIEDRKVRLELSLAFAESDEAREIWGDELTDDVQEILRRRLGECDE